MSRELPYAELVSDRPAERFLTLLQVTQPPIRELLIVSPIIGTLRDVQVNLRDLRRLIERQKTTTYVITNTPTQGPHQQAVNVLRGCPYIEIRYNDSLHAKVYSCVGGTDRGFAMLGSANLTRTSVIDRIEIAILLRDRGPHGKALCNQLRAWGVTRLRTLSKIEQSLARR